MNGPAVYLVDDDSSFLNAQARMLRAAGFEVHAFERASQLADRVSHETRGCVVTDLSMPDMTGLELQAALAQKGAALPLVFLTGHADVPSTVLAMREGAVDFLEKTAPQEKLLESVGRALDRDAAQHQERTRLFELRRRFARLTPREHEVLAQVVMGMMNKQIAARLGIHERTVKLHRSSIVAKMGVHSVAQLATLARDAGLSAVPPRNAASHEADDGTAPRRNA